MRPLGLSGRALARALDVPSNRVTEIISGRRQITADTAHRLARYFGNSPEFWMGLQTAYDLTKAADGDFSMIAPRDQARAL